MSRYGPPWLKIRRKDRDRCGTSAFALGLLLSVAATVVLAHEGHTPLPSQGEKVDVVKGLVMLSAEARFVLDVQTTEIGTTAPPDTILA